MGGTGEPGLYGYMGTSNPAACRVTWSASRPRCTLTGPSFPAGAKYPGSQVLYEQITEYNARERTTSYEVMRLISACRVARYTQYIHLVDRLAGWWRLVFGEQVTEQSTRTSTGKSTTRGSGVESSKLLLRKKLPQHKGKERHHSVGQSLSVLASLQSCFCFCFCFTGRKPKYLWTA